MRQLSLFILVLLTLTLGCSRKPKTQKDQLSYTVGLQFGRSLRAQNLDLDANVVARGIVDGIKGEKGALSDEEMQTTINHAAEEKQRQQKVEADKNKVSAESFLETNKGIQGVKVSASGLQYKISQPGIGPAPKDGDTVVVNYKGTLIDGSEFDSSYKRGVPAEFPLNGVIPGWTEGLKMLKKGGKAIFYIPPELGYGDRPRQQIPANAVLIFDVELVDIKAGATTKH